MLHCTYAARLTCSILLPAHHSTCSGLSELLLGSVAAHCTAHSPRPVLVLHLPLHAASRERSTQCAGSLSEPLASPAAPAESGEGTAAEGGGAGLPGASRQERSIVLPVDDSEESERACAWAVQHLYRPGDAIHLLRVVPSLPSL